MGAWALENLRRGGFRGRIFPVNPRYGDIGGVRCHATLGELPERVDLVIFAVGDRQLEAALDAALEARIPAAVIMSTLYLDDDRVPMLRERVAAKVGAAGMLVCGANGMGFYNVRDHVWACGFDSAMHDAPGNVAIISHSGAGMSGIIDCEQRLRINVAVSTGNEISVAMDDYLDFVLDLPETRVVGLFIESARNPAGFRAALAKAARRRIPVVALKVGRTAEAARLAVSHSGAMAGDDASFEALFDRYGVQRVSDQDTWATALIMFAEMHPLGAGGLVTLHDSGGERQLLIDLAHDAGVPLTRLAPATVAALEGVLDPELPAVNPLDAWSRGGPGAADAMTNCLTLMMQDEGAAMGAVVHDRAPGGGIYTSYLGYMQGAHAASGKPVCLVSARAGTGQDDAVVTSTHAGLPVLDGVRPFLEGCRALMRYRDFERRPSAPPRALDSSAVDKWRARLGRGDTLTEAESLAMLAEFGLDVAQPVVANDAAAAAIAAARLGYPLVLKTGERGVPHKSDRGGVLLDIRDEAELQAAYAELDERFGPAVLVAPMAGPGEEFILGARSDPQFGPVALLGFGGTLAETLGDVVFALPPFDAAHARRSIDRLRLRPLLDGVRGRPRTDIDALCEAAATFSALVHGLRDVIAEFDVNPLIVTETAAIVVDALVVGRAPDTDADA